MVAMCPGKRAVLDKNDAIDRIVDKIEYLKASASQGGASVSGDQTAVWIRESALPWFEENTA
jgi:hypothetical protein